MEIPHYLALSPAEFSYAAPLPPHTAWMSCRFSPYGKGLTNLPESLPENSICILDDRNPARNHDPEEILSCLSQVLTTFRCRGLILDFQDEKNQRQQEIARYLIRRLPFPVAAPPAYAGEDGIVFLPPVPAELSVKGYLSPWKGRKIWLDTANSRASLTLSASGCRISHPEGISAGNVFWDRETGSRYSIREIPGGLQVVLERRAKDLPRLLQEAALWGAELAVGLWQEFG